MKHLTIIYDNATLYDGDVAELVWSDSDNGVKVEGRVKPAKMGAGGGAGGLLEMLTKASKARTAQVADEKREEYAAEVVEPELVEESA